MTTPLRACTVLASIDHALLNPTLSERELQQGCALAARLGVATVCVTSKDVGRALQWLGSGATAVSSVVGFPFANVPLSVLLDEARLALDAGAIELDMPVPVGRVISGDWEVVNEQVARCQALVERYKARLKVIIEAGWLPDDATKARLCLLCKGLGVAFVKTSTGFATRRASSGELIVLGATPQDVKLMVETVGPSVGVKASGNIRTLKDARLLLELGATRLGTSSTAQIAQEVRAEARG